jgi:tRNA threonylcarbamoyladenosine biosynthesis protein TsaE
LTERSRDSISSSEEETRSIGERIGKRVKTGAVLAIEGELGAGKTCLIQGIARGLGIDSSIPVNSPSYVIINEYPGPVPLYHFDLYRLHEERELVELDWQDYLGRKGVIVIEWADRISSVLPPGHIRIVMEMTGPNSRLIKFWGLSKL